MAQLPSIRAHALRLICLVHVIVSLARITAAEDAWERWGPYRPNLYFGVRPQIPSTLLIGLMWAGVDDITSKLGNLRDTCEQDDGIIYGWSAYDVRDGGVHVVNDTKNHVDIVTEFTKTADGNSWGMQVRGVRRRDAPHGPLRTALIFHVAIEGVAEAEQGTKVLRCAPAANRQGGMFAECTGTDPALGGFKIDAFNVAGNVVEGPAITSASVEKDKEWQAREIFESTQMSRQGHGDGNIHFLKSVFENDFQVDFIYSVESAPRPDGGPINVGNFDSRLDGLVATFRGNIDNIFPPAVPFNTEEYRNFGQHLLSNLMGGLGFFHGDSKVDLSHAEAYEETSLDFWKEAANAMAAANVTVTQPISLLSHSPSRPFFPRGFLWDEGFHLLPVVEWDFDHAVTVLKSWLHRMDNDGWIPREQILGPEARSKVPPEFQVQYPHIANPPTFIALLLPVILDKVTGESTYIGHPSKHLSSPAESKAMLQELFVLLGRHYLWFRRTQPGNMTEGVYPRPDDAGTTEAYRWRGRTPGHNLASGLDDYPRAEPPHPGELHVDALSWVAASALALNRLAEHLNHKDDAARYARHAEDARHNLDALHWSEAAGAYCDTTVVPPPEGGAGPGDFSHVCHLGYVSLFPFLLGLLPPDHAHLPRLIDLLADRSANGLWSDHGLRSLRPADEHYGKDEDYWRGAVWMNINVLAVQRLAELGSGVGWAAPGVNETDQVQQLRKRSAKLAIDLRQNVVRTVHDEWRRTGFVWEQYGDRDGKGRRSRAFTGWTACVILLLRMFLEGGGGSGSSAGASSGWSVALAALAVVGLVAAAGAMRHRLLGLYRNLTAVVSNRARGRFRQLPQEETDDWHVLQPLAGRS